MFTTASYIIIGFICFIFAPFMTIGTILVLGGFKILGALFIILGFIHMIARWGSQF